MRRVGRFIFNGVTVLSLLICLATGVIWVRGFWSYDTLTKSEEGYEWEVCLGAGEITLDRIQDFSFHIRPFTRSSYRREAVYRGDAIFSSKYQPPHVIERDWSVPGIAFHAEHISLDIFPTIYLSQFRLSYWLIVLLTLILPASRILRRKHDPPGLCPNCHYDLRATPHRCPECGHVPARAAEKTT